MNAKLRLKGKRNILHIKTQANITALEIFLSEDTVCFSDFLMDFGPWEVSIFKSKVSVMNASSRLKDKRNTYQNTSKQSLRNKQTKPYSKSSFQKTHFLSWIL